MDAIKLLGNLLNNNSMGSSVLGGLMGGGSKSGGGGGGGGGLGALVGMLGGGGGRSGGSGGGGGLGALASLLGGGKGDGGGGGLGALASMFGGGGQGGGGGGLGALAGLLGGAGGGGNEPQQLAAEPAPEEAQHEATLLIRAMCNAAKADGRLDDAEKQAILGRLGEVTQDEIDFVQGELNSPLDVDGLVADVPAGAEQQVYTFSLMAIKLDEQSEARYLADLARGLRLEGETCNAIHEQLGAPQIFS